MNHQNDQRMNASDQIQSAPTDASLPLSVSTPLLPAPQSPTEATKENDLPVVSQVLGAIDRLSPEEAAVLQRCETIIVKGWDAQVDMGLALGQIRDGELYREQYSSFEEYCQGRWGFGRVKVHNAITAARVFTTIAALTDVPKPDHEAPLRPLFTFDDDSIRLVWQVAAANSRGRKITEKMVRAAVKELQMKIKPPVTPTRVNKTEQRKLVTATLTELMMLARKNAPHHELLSKLEVLHGQIQRLFEKRVTKKEGAPQS